MGTRDGYIMSGGWGVGYPGGEVALTSRLPVSVGFGSDGMEWVGGAISGLHQEKPGKQPAG